MNTTIDTTVSSYGIVNSSQQQPTTVTLLFVYIGIVYNKNNIGSKQCRGLEKTLYNLPQ